MISSSVLLLGIFTSELPPSALLLRWDHPTRRHRCPSQVAIHHHLLVTMALHRHRAITEAPLRSNMEHRPITPQVMLRQDIRRQPPAILLLQVANTMEAILLRAILEGHMVGPHQLAVHLGHLLRLEASPCVLCQHHRQTIISGLHHTKLGTVTPMPRADIILGTVIRTPTFPLRMVGLHRLAVLLTAITVTVEVVLMTTIARRLQDMIHEARRPHQKVTVGTPISQVRIHITDRWVHLLVIRPRMTEVDPRQAVALTARLLPRVGVTPTAGGTTLTERAAAGVCVVAEVRNTCTGACAAGCGHISD